MVETMKKYLALIMCLVVASCSIVYAGLNKETVERVKQATVFIVMKSYNNSSINNPDGTGLCSGFVINEERHIVTNYHCIHNAEELKLAFYDKDDWNVYEVVVIGKDPLSDLAVIHIPERKKPLPYLEWSDEIPWDGMDVFAVGHPFGMIWSVTKGIISNQKRHIRTPYVRLLQSDVAINSGNSGGPLVNTAGKVVGVNAMILNPSPTPVKTNIGLALSVRNDDAKEIIEIIKDGKEVVRPMLGVQIADLTPMNRDTIANMPEVKEAGVTVPNTFGCFVAPMAGIPEGLEQFDVIVGLDGKAINRQEELTDIIRSKKVGDVVNLLIIRDKLFKNVNVTLKKLETDPSTLYDKSGKVNPPNNK